MIILDDDVLRAVDTLSLSISKLINGYFPGMHNGARMGQGLDFRQYKGYQAGDDIRNMDWKLYARSGKYFIKESDVETRLKLNLIVDATASMSFEEESESKWHRAAVLCIAICHLALKSGDSIDIYLVQSNITKLISVNSKKDLPTLSHVLSEVTPQGTWPAESNYFFSEIGKSPKGMNWILSDFLDEPEDLEKWLKVLKVFSVDIKAIKVGSRVEEELALSGNYQFSDLESVFQVEGNVSRIRDSYLEKIEKHFHQIQDIFLHLEGELYAHYLNESVYDVLSDAFKKG